MDQGRVARVPIVARASVSATVARRIQSLDLALPVAAKLGLALAAIVGLTAIFLAVALPPIRIELERAYAGEAWAIATTVQAEYALHGSDRAELALFLRGMVSADPSIARGSSPRAAPVGRGPGRDAGTPRWTSLSPFPYSAR